ncbi:hypothetical protein [Bacillus infantis]|uniref:hypothetical protein n=1 Tax=Bacillus infantis TaxID=324767 RepID=UPI003CEE895D
MCLYGVQKLIRIINPNQSKKQVYVDSCIAAEILDLNNQGIITISCCCGHGRAGQVIEYRNGTGVWKEYVSPPHVLIAKDSVAVAKLLGYSPFPYFYADGKSYDTWQMQLNSGCITENDCEIWHHKNRSLLSK